MRTNRVIHTVSCHAEGEIGDVIVGGVAPPPGDTLWEQRDFIARDGKLRDFMINEPHGGVFRHVNLLVPPTDPKADAAFIIMEAEDIPPMSGSNAMCVATVVLDTGLVAMEEPRTRLTLQAPAGLVEVVADCADGKAQRITLRNVPSFVHKLDADLDIPGFGTRKVDVAFGGDSYVLIDAASLDLEIVPGRADELARIGSIITDAANEQLGFAHPQNAWDHISFCQFTAPPKRTDAGLEALNTVVIKPAKLDRSPCGTGSSARMAVLHARGELSVDEPLITRSIIGSRFHCRIIEETQLAGQPAIIPELSGRAWITGIHQHFVDPDDPWPLGYRLADTWPNWRGETS